MEKIKEVVLILILFFYIYAPRAYNINSMHILFGISLIYIILNFKFIRKELKADKIVHYNILYMLFLLGYVFIIARDKNYIKAYVLSFIEVPLISYAIVVYLKKSEVKLDDLIKKIIYVGMIQAIIAISSLYIMPLKKILFNLFILSNYVIPHDVLKYKQMFQYRLNGIGNGLLFTMPVAQAIISSFSLIYYKKMRGLVYSLILLFSGIINGRVSLVVFISCLILIEGINFYKNSFRDSLKNIIKISLVFLVLFMGFKIIFKDTKTLNWILAGINEIIGYFKGERIGTFEYLSGKKFNTLPEGISLFIGTGNDIFMGKKIGNEIVNSDKGYINDLWLGGFLYIVPLYMFFIINYIKLYYYKSVGIINLKIISLIFIISSILSHIKGNFYMAGSIWNLIVLVIVFCFIELKMDERGDSIEH